MSRVYIAIFTMLLLLCSFPNADAKLTLKEVRTASNDVLVAFFNSNIVDVNEGVSDSFGK